MAVAAAGRGSAAEPKRPAGTAGDDGALAFALAALVAFGVSQPASAGLLSESGGKLDYEDSGKSVNQLLRRSVYTKSQSKILDMALAKAQEAANKREAEARAKAKEEEEFKRLAAKKKAEEAAKLEKEKKLQEARAKVMAQLEEKAQAAKKADGAQGA